VPLHDKNADFVLFCQVDGTDFGVPPFDNIPALVWMFLDKRGMGHVMWQFEMGDIDGLIVGSLFQHFPQKINVFISDRHQSHIDF
jgi:hypothetical protein